MGTSEIVVSFLAYSVLGWIIDTAWRSFEAGRFARGGFTKYPFSPIYGFGALLALGFATMLHGWSLWMQWVALALLLGGFEYVGGVLVVRFMKRRLWNYSKSPVDIEGHTTPWRAVVWGLLGLFLIYVLHPSLLALCRALEACPSSMR